MKTSRRDFLQSGAAGFCSASLGMRSSAVSKNQGKRSRRFQFVQIDVFTSRKLEGNPLAVFPDARGLTGDEMLAIARETYLQETTFVVPRNPAIEQANGVKVHIYTPQEEIPFGGHPVLGTAMVLRNRRRSKTGGNARITEIAMDLKVGKIAVVFTGDASGHLFGEMRQIDPVFGRVHDCNTVAALIGVKPSDISVEWPIQTVSTGLQFALVPLKSLAILQSLRPDQSKIRSYFNSEPVPSDFYYVTRDTRDPNIGLRARSINPEGEDPATGSAAGCAAAWMIRHGIAQPGQIVHIQQGIEIKRPSQIYVRADKSGDKVINVRVGGNAVEVVEGTYYL